MTVFVPNLRLANVWWRGAPLANLFSNIEEKLGLMKWEKGKGLTALIRSKMKLNLSSIIQNVQPDCLQTGESSALRTKLIIRSWKTRKWFIDMLYCLSNVFWHFSQKYNMKKVYKSLSIINPFFSLPDNPGKFTCSKNVHTRSSQPKCFGQKLGDTARSQRKSDVFTPNKQRSQRREARGEVGGGGRWGWVQMALI